MFKYLKIPLLAVSNCSLPFKKRKKKTLMGIGREMRIKRRIIFKKRVHYIQDHIHHICEFWISWKTKISNLQKLWFTQTIYILYICIYAHTHIHTHPPKKGKIEKYSIFRITWLTIKGYLLFVFQRFLYTGALSHSKIVDWQKGWPQDWGSSFVK